MTSEPAQASRGRAATGLLAVGFVLLWNSGFVGAEFTLPYTGPLTLLFWRYGLLTTLLGAGLWSRGRLVWPGRGAALSAMGVGVLAHGCWLGCVFVSLQRGVPAGIVALVVALQPMTTGALSGWVVGEPTSPRRWAGLILGFLGVGITVLARFQRPDSYSLAAYLLPFGSVAAITAASLWQRRLRVRAHPWRLPLAQSLWYQSLGAAVSAAPFAVAFEGLETEWTPGFVAGLLWVSLAVSLGAYGLMWTLVDRWNATRVASLFFLGPPVTLLMAWIAFGDALRATDGAGFAVVVLGMVLSEKKS